MDERIYESIFPHTIEIKPVSEQASLKLREQKAHFLATGLHGAVKKGDKDEVLALLTAKGDIEALDQVINNALCCLVSMQSFD